jgi:pSer/pThr/pTyr-binding forkhead associated (FHA) protein
MGEPKTFYFHNLSNSTSFELKDDTIIGRGEDADITIYDDKISSKHLHITVNENSVFVKDLDTSNGTLINGLEVKPNSKYEVSESDKIVIGRVTLLCSESPDLVNEKTNQQDNLRELESLNLSGVEIEFEGGHQYAGDSIDLESPKRKIRNENLKIKKIERELIKIDSKIERKKEFLEKLEELKNKNIEILKVGPSLKEKYDESYEEWKGINLKLKKIEREHNKLKETRLTLSPIMEKYESYKEVSLEQSDLLSEVKRLSRENLSAKRKECSDRIGELHQSIFQCEERINEMAREKEKEKEREKERIRKQIADLQAKLDETG